MSFVRSAIFVAVFCATVAGLTASPAAADSGPHVHLGLTVTSTHPDGSLDETRNGSLTCNPTGGGHRNPSAACAELIAAGGDLRAADHEMTGACPLYVAPVTVRAIGSYDGSPVDYMYTYSNPCFFAATASQVWNI